MNTCPLPLDWLDLLEGRPSAADRAHLDKCPSCWAVVRALSDSATTSEGSLVPKLPDYVAEARNVSLPAPPVFDQPGVGQLWWTVEIPEMSSRLAILIIDVEDAGSPRWLNAVPLWLDDTEGTSGDVLFSSEDTSTDMGWRALLRYQLVLSDAQLDEPIGALTDSGAVLLEQILSGQTVVGRSGNSIESQYDPKLAADEWIAVAARALASAYASNLHVQALRPDPEAAVTVGPDISGARLSGTLLVLYVSRQPAPKEELSYQLAAATASNAVHWVRAAGADLGAGVHVDGWLRLSDSEELIFEIKQAEGVPEVVRLTAYAKHLPEAITTSVQLKAGGSVILGSDLGISEFDVERLEIRT